MLVIKLLPPHEKGTTRSSVSGLAADPQHRHALPHLSHNARNSAAVYSPSTPNSKARRRFPCAAILAGFLRLQRFRLRARCALRCGSRLRRRSTPILPRADGSLGMPFGKPCSSSGSRPPSEDACRTRKGPFRLHNPCRPSTSPHKISQTISGLTLR